MKEELKGIQVEHTLQEYEMPFHTFDMEFNIVSV